MGRYHKIRDEMEDRWGISAMNEYLGESVVASICGNDT